MTHQGAAPDRGRSVICVVVAVCVRLSRWFEAMSHHVVVCLSLLLLLGGAAVRRADAYLIGLKGTDPGNREGTPELLLQRDVNRQRVSRGNHTMILGHVEFQPVCGFGRIQIINCIFYRAMLCIRGTSHELVSVRLSVCPSQVGVLLKRLNVGSQEQHYTIGQGL